MVFVLASICDHASNTFIFSSTSSDQICLVSSEHFRKYRWRLLFTFAGAFSEEFLRASVLKKRQENEKAFFQKHSASACMVPQSVSQFCHT